MRSLVPAVFLISLTILPARTEPFSDNYPAADHWGAAPFAAYPQQPVRPWPWRAVQPHRPQRGSTVSRSCLTAETRGVLNRLEANFGPVRVVSTCRPGAVIAGTRRPSYHRYGKAVDFHPPQGRRAEVIRWLRANNSGMVITYARMGHVHFDTGPYRSVACAECGTRRMRRAHAASAAAR